MPWEKAFDMDDAVDRATEVFWSKGYEATSLSDLLEATGINRGSFYNAFGSKKKLFVQSILKYEREQRRQVLEEFAALNDPVLAINKLFDAIIAQSETDKARKGCFLVNTALDLPNHEPDIQKTVRKSLKGTEAFFEGQLKIGKEQGVIPDHVDTETAAKGLLALLVGVRVLARGIFDARGLKAIKKQALKIIE